MPAIAGIQEILARSATLNSYFPPILARTLLHTKRHRSYALEATHPSLLRKQESSDCMATTTEQCLTISIAGFRPSPE